MGTYGTTIIKKQGKKICLTDSHDGYLSGMGASNILGVALSPSTAKLRELFDKFNTKSKEWTEPGSREVQAAIHDYSLSVSDPSARELFGEQINDELRPSCAGFLPILFLGVHTGYSDDSDGGYVIDLDREVFEYQCNEDFTIAIPFDKLRNAGAQRGNFFAHHFDDILDDLSVAAKDFVNLDGYIDGEGNRIAYRQNDEPESLDEIIEGIGLIKNEADRKERIAELHRKLEAVFDDFLTLDIALLDEYERRIDLERQKKIEEYEQRSRPSPRAAGDRKNTSFSIHSCEVDLARAREFIYLFDLLVRSRSKNVATLLKKVNWFLDNDEENPNQLKVFLRIRIDDDDTEGLLQKFADTLWHGFDFKMNIMSQAGIGFFGDQEEEQEEFATQFGLTEFAGLSPDHADAVEKMFPLILYNVFYPDARQTLLDSNPSIGIQMTGVHFAALYRDVETFRHLMKFVIANFQKLTDEQKAQVGEHLLKSVATAKTLYDKTEQSDAHEWQKPFDEFITGARDILEFVSPYMKDFEKTAYLAG